MTGTSQRTAERGKAIVENGAPELVKAVEEEEVSTADAAAIADETPEVQRKAVEDVKAGKAGTAKAAVEAAKAKANEEEEEVEVTVDDWGIPISPSIAEAFAAQADFDELLSVLREAKRMYKALADKNGGQYLTVPGIGMNAKSGWQHAGIETAILQVKDARPKFATCPFMHNKNHKHEGKECGLCHGLGWLGSISKDRVPEELIQAAKKAHGVS